MSTTTCPDYVSEILAISEALDVLHHRVECLGGTLTDVSTGKMTVYAICLPEDHSFLETGTRCYAVEWVSGRRAYALAVLEEALRIVEGGTRGDLITLDDHFPLTVLDLVDAADAVGATVTEESACMTATWRITAPDGCLWADGSVPSFTVCWPTQEADAGSAGLAEAIARMSCGVVADLLLDDLGEETAMSVTEWDLSEDGADRDFDDRYPDLDAYQDAPVAPPFADTLTPGTLCYSWVHHREVFFLCWEGKDGDLRRFAILADERGQILEEPVYRDFLAQAIPF